MAFGSPRVMKDETTYYTKPEIDALLNGAKNYRDRFLILFIARTGRRISEVVKVLTPRDIFPDRNMINFTILKRRVPTKRMIKVDPDLMNKIVDYVYINRLGPDDPLFNITRIRAFQIARDAAKAAGLRIGNMRVLRHSFAVEAAKRAKTPAEIIQVRDLLAHSDINITMFYLRFNPEAQEEILKKMWSDD